MEVLQAGSADEWQDVVSQCFIPINCGGFEPGFHGQMDYLPLDEGLSISSVATDGHKVDRSDRLAARAEVDDLHLSLQLTSRGTVRQGRRMVSVRPGAASMYATDSPYYLDYSEPGQRQLIVQVSRASIDAPRADVAAGLGKLTIPSGDATRVFFSYARTLHRQGDIACPAQAAEAAEVARDLAGVMIHAAASGVRAVPRTHGGLLRAFEDYIASHLQTVSVDEVAAEFFVSRRMVYTVFEQAGTTPSEYVRNARLDLAAARLTDPHQAHAPIAEVAASVGFSDPTTFTRAFRRRHGMVPREFRAARLGAPAAA